MCIVFCLHDCLCVTCMLGACGGHKWASDLLAIELQTVVSYHWCCELNPGLLEELSVLLAVDPFIYHCLLLFCCLLLSILHIWGKHGIVIWFIDIGELWFISLNVTISNYFYFPVNDMIFLFFKDDWCLIFHWVYLPYILFSGLH